MTDFASCCLLSYNRPDFLLSAVRSLTENAGWPLELIIHDDGSSDPRLDELLWRFKQDGATVIQNRPGHNQGVGTAVNRMFSIAKGDPLVKIDQDLTFEPGWLRTIATILERNRTERIGFGEPLIGALGAFRYHVEPCIADEQFVARHSEGHGAWEHHRDFVGSLTAVPRDVWEDYGPWEEHSTAFSEDVAFKDKLRADGLVMALPPEDIATNHGFGVGPSTVCTSLDSVQSIKKEPVILGRG